MIRQQAFDGKKKMLKGGLHCHTTRSDGRGSPEEVIRLHYQNGYDFLALTDHRIYNHTNYAPDCPITILPGMEIDHYLPANGGFRCYHTVCLGPAKEAGNKFDDGEGFPSGSVASDEEYQPILDSLHAGGNLTMLCHPEWSGTPARYFENLKGNFAMEIWNTGCVLENDMDMDAAYWDDLLDQGKKIYGAATDDGHAMNQHCKGWVMVNAENNVSDILDALREGKFYSSCGPEIYDFHIENDTVVIECSPAAKIRLHSMKHPTRICRSEDGTLTRAEFKIKKEDYRYIRITVIDSDGKYAWTNPIFFE